MDAKAVGSHSPLFREIPPADPIFPVVKNETFGFFIVNVLKLYSCTTVLLYLMLFNFHTQTGLSMITAIVQKSVMMEKVKRKKATENWSCQ